MDENKPLKYLRYAIGEIVLVVIGILIALQINTWQNEQFNKKQEKYYLSQLKSEFQSNLQEAERNMQFCNLQSKNANLLLKSLDEPLSETESKDWFFALIQLTFTPKTNYEDNTWGEMIATNKLELVTNKELLTEIRSFYSTLNFNMKMEMESEHSNILFREMANEILDHKLREKIFDEFLKKWKDNSDLILIEVYPEDIPAVQPYVEKFKGIKGIVGRASDIKANRMTAYMDHEKLKGWMMKIIDRLDREQEL